MAWIHGRATSSTPGIPTRILSAHQIVKVVTFQALRANTGFVALGNSGVRVRDGEQNAISLAVPATSTPQMQTFTDIDLYDFFLDVTVTNEGVAYTAQI